MSGNISALDVLSILAITRQSMPRRGLSVNSPPSPAPNTELVTLQAHMQDDIKVDVVEMSVQNNSILQCQRPTEVRFSHT
jgi:hypothetical protein